MTRLVVVEAAAGCGKTTALARHALELVADGLPLERVVAITFTRKAAAELQQRLAAALRACLPGDDGARARAELGAAWSAYEGAAPTDPERARRALAALPHAPVGTTDRFVQDLLTEFALDAALPLPDGGRAPVDVPVRAVASIAGHVEQAARELLDPPDGLVDPDVALLCEHLTLEALLEVLCRRGPHDALPAFEGAALFGEVARALAILLRRHPLPLAPEDEVVARWLARGGEPDEAPLELVPFVRALPARRDTRPLLEAVRRATFELGVARVGLAELVGLLRPPWHRVEDLRRSDALRAAVDRLRSRAASEALRRAARAGELDHDALTRAAIALCEAPPPRLHGRFRALLVDEAQDADPTQLRLYAALAALPGPEPVRAFFVGDARQSIYLFRDAEPSGFAALARRAREAGDLRALGTNRRSSPALVQAQRALFAALVEPARARGLTAPEPLDGVEPHPDNHGLALDPERCPPPEPVWFVRGRPGEALGARDADRRALFAFLERVRAAWEVGDDTAAVLAPTWALAREARDLLRGWSGSAGVAFVEGGSPPPGARPLADLRALLAALHDPADELAWLAVWKHPTVGLSDRAVARIRAGVGLDLPEGAEAPRTFGRLLEARGLLPPHDPSDRLAFERAAPLLRETAEALGTRDTAGLLDELLDALGWRAVYAAGPGGDEDVALLEVLLEQIRAGAMEGLDPEALLRALREDELPQVHLDRPARHVACTTVFQAKGRAWDHVMLWSPGRPARAPEDPTVQVRRPGREPARLTGTCWDPRGGLSPEPDPIGRLAASIAARRFDEEGLRLAYVGMSRARRSVTLGLPDRTRRLEAPQALLAERWGERALEAPGVATVRRPAPPEPAPRPTGWAAPRPGAPAAPAAPDARAWIERAPSALGAALAPGAARELAEWTASRVRLSGGLHAGGPSADPPDRDGVPATAWGTVAHGWLAAWGFRGAPGPEEVARWLRDDHDLDDPAVRDWLVAMSRGLAAHGGPLWALVTDPGVRLRFEVPLVGVDRGLLLSGRVDLLVERAGRLTVVDFKAGARAPRDPESLLAALDSHAPQLEAYRAALEGMGHPVEGVALWFVRSGASLRW